MVHMVHHDHDDAEDEPNLVLLDLNSTHFNFSKKAG